MADLFYAGSFGPHSLLFSSIDSNDGREFAIHSPARGDVHTIQDRGRVHRRTQAELLFTVQPGLRESPLARFRAFQKTVNEGKPQIFTHPIAGSYRARVDDFKYSVGADDREVRASCTFLADEDVPAVFEVGAGVSRAAGPEEVAITVSELYADMEALNLQAEIPGVPVTALPSTTVPTESLAKVQSWSERAESESRTILLEVASLSSQIDDEIERLELATDLARWPIYRGFVQLRYQVARAAESTTAATARAWDLLVTASLPIRVLCARVYGARDADERAGQVRQLNPDLENPALAPAGTTLKMPAVEGASRA